MSTCADCDGIVVGHAIMLALASAAQHLAWSPPLEVGDESVPLDERRNAERSRLLSECDRYLASVGGPNARAEQRTAMSLLASSPDVRAAARAAVVAAYGEAAVVPVRAFGEVWREFGQVAL